MTTTEATPAEITRTAAAYLHGLVKAAPDGPWFLDHEEAERQEENADDPWFRREYADSHDWRIGTRPIVTLDDGSQGWFDGWFVQDDCKLGFAHLAATMGPQVAGPLAEWLAHAAERMSVYDESFEEDTPGGRLALQIARAVLP